MVFVINSIGSNTKLLLSNGRYKKVSDIVTTDRLINKIGSPTEIKNIIKLSRHHARLYDVHTELWHTVTTISENQKYWTRTPDRIILETNIHLDYSLGFLYGVLYRLGFITQNGTVIMFCKKENASFLKQFNNIFASKVGVNKAIIKIHKFIVEYNIDDESISRMIKEKDIPISDNTDYMKGLQDGILKANMYGETFNVSNESLNEACNLCNILLSNSNKNVRFYAERNIDYKGIMYDIESATGSFIGNNIVFTD